MKNRAARILAVGTALMALAAVHAQTRVMTANVPFDFYAGSTLMPHGTYLVNETPQGGVAWIKPQNKAGKPVLTVSVVGKDRTEPVLIFHCIDQEYFLAQIWTANGTTGQAIPASAREKELTRSGATRTEAAVRLVINR
jgi:hypothetical protein